MSVYDWRARVVTYMAEKAAKLRANGNTAAADALIKEYCIPPDRIPTLEVKGHRRGKSPRIRAEEETPPPKIEPVNKQFARRRARA